MCARAAVLFPEVQTGTIILSGQSRLSYSKAVDPRMKPFRSPYAGWLIVPNLVVLYVRRCKSSKGTKWGDLFGWARVSADRIFKCGIVKYWRAFTHVLWNPNQEFCRMRSDNPAIALLKVIVDMSAADLVSSPKIRRRIGVDSNFHPARVRGLDLLPFCLKMGSSVTPGRMNIFTEFEFSTAFCSRLMDLWARAGRTGTIPHYGPPTGRTM